MHLVLQTLKRETSPHKSAVRFKSAPREGTAVTLSKIPEPIARVKTMIQNMHFIIAMLWCIGIQSHSIGPGATYERVQFNITGRSPLVQHFMSIHHLCDDSSSNYQVGPTLTRTEIKALPYPFVQPRVHH